VVAVALAELLLAEDRPDDELSLGVAQGLGR
jgi:hypothetical protein